MVPMRWAMWKVRGMPTSSACLKRFCTRGSRKGRFVQISPMPLAALVLVVAEEVAEGRIRGIGHGTRIDVAEGDETAGVGLGDLENILVGLAKIGAFRVHHGKQYGGFDLNGVVPRQQLLGRGEGGFAVSRWPGNSAYVYVDVDEHEEVPLCCLFRALIKRSGQPRVPLRSRSAGAAVACELALVC